MHIEPQNEIEKMPDQMEPAISSNEEDAFDYDAKPFDDALTEEESRDMNDSDSSYKGDSDHAMISSKYLFWIGFI